MRGTSTLPFFIIFRKALSILVSPPVSSPGAGVQRKTQPRRLIGKVSQTDTPPSSASAGILAAFLYSLKKELQVTLTKENAAVAQLSLIHI